ncbi:Protein kinase superfamily protein [Abeliophyllum distichum]|uniref:Protein kinase superfamily protein n=1 Tax=Abeliophyllum distichum TaxID=126358 RepID=A0ABD1QLF5_9LAMI
MYNSVVGDWRYRQAAAGSNSQRRNDLERRGSRESRALPAPDANAELVSSIRKRRGQSNSRSRSEMFNSHHEEVASGFPIDPPRPSQALEEASNDPQENIHRRSSHSGPLVNRAAWLEIPTLSARIPGSFKESSNSMTRQDEKKQVIDVSQQHVDKRNINDPVPNSLISFSLYSPAALWVEGQQNSLLWTTTRVLVPSGKADEILKDRDRQIQEAARRGRVDKARLRKLQVEGNQLSTTLPVSGH